MKYTCQNLSQSIIKLGQLKSDLDLATRDDKTDIAKGLDCQMQIIEILNLYSVIIRLNYRFLVESVGSHEGLAYRISDLAIGGDTAKELQDKLEERDEKTGRRKFYIKEAQYILDKIYNTEEFKRLAQNPEHILTIRLKVRELGFRDIPTNDEIYTRAKELGLKLCPAVVGAYQRLKDGDQWGGWYRIAMKQIISKDNHKEVLRLGNDSGTICLSTLRAESNQWQNLDNILLFCLRSK
ncbi:MAG: hypothetical protein NTW50_04070 [Candidatus Berkelbacteria bacterium]|nr:hypothetical protein [Candidatus Berkelbacteria bacterium]